MGNLIHDLLISASIVLVIALTFAAAIQRSTISDLRNEVDFWKGRDAQWRDPNQPRPLPVGQSTRA